MIEIMTQIILERRGRGLIEIKNKKPEYFLDSCTRGHFIRFLVRQELFVKLFLELFRPGPGNFGLLLVTSSNSNQYIIKKPYF